jgi:hypothetical protein
MGFMRESPEPLPGTHLARTVCVYCGTPVLAVPERAREAVCAGCGRQEAGAGTPAGVRFPSARHRAQRRQGPAVPEPLPWRVTCNRCEWVGRVGTATDVWLALRVHEQVTHDQDGWLSGIRGGNNDPWGGATRQRGG